MKELPVIKGRGAQSHIPNRFDKTVSIRTLEIGNGIKTKYLPTHPKSILNQVDSPDLPFEWSLNPYQGCEHGCVYCYARPTHNYWGYNAGLDFESVILVKENAAELLNQKFKSKNWQASPIMLSGNTDCYQPIESKLKITRKILQVCLFWRHPVCIITKNSMIERDLDILKQLAVLNLVRVAFSITGLDEKMRRILEPRTSTYGSRLKSVKKLTDENIPVTVMMAPIIPSINDHEIISLGERVADAGALAINGFVIRLNQEVEHVFKEWLQKHFADRYHKIIGKIKDLHGGKVGDNRFKIRMKGEGNYASIIHSQLKMVNSKYFGEQSIPQLNLEHYARRKNPQLDLFAQKDL